MVITCDVYDVGIVYTRYSKRAISVHDRHLLLKILGPNDRLSWISDSFDSAYFYWWQVWQTTYVIWRGGPGGWRVLANVKIKMHFDVALMDSGSIEIYEGECWKSNEHGNWLYAGPSVYREFHWFRSRVVGRIWAFGWISTSC